jgi:acyl-CoA synthetase (AMP-forming)/AMP-acid ligase II
MTALDKYRVTLMHGLVDSFVELIEHPERDRFDLTSLRMTGVSSFVKKMTADYRCRWKEVSGSVMREGGYGMTETHTLDTFTTGMQKDDFDIRGRPVFVGLPMPGTRVKIVDFDTGKLLPLGEEGEIVIQSPSMMRGYWNKPEETRSQLVDGWLHTGDIGMLDQEGYLYFLGRTKEMLKVKGMSVFPSEIEALLGRHPAINGSGVVGKPDQEKSEIPVAFVMLKPEFVGRVSAGEITAWCRKNMAGFKVPEIRLVDQLPLTATGKVQKTELQRMLD